MGPDDAPAGGTALAIWSWVKLTDLRFFEFPGVGGWGKAAKGSGGCAGAVAGCRLGRSPAAAAAKAAPGWGFAAMGEGFRFRLAAGEEL